MYIVINFPLQKEMEKRFFLPVYLSLHFYSKYIDHTPQCFKHAGESLAIIQLYFIGNESKQCSFFRGYYIQSSLNQKS